MYKPFASTFHASVVGNIVAIVQEGLLQNGTTFPAYNATLPVSVATTTSKHGLGKDVELSQPEEDEFGKRKFRTEILRTSRANHFESNEQDFGKFILSDVLLTNSMVNTYVIDVVRCCLVSLSLVDKKREEKITIRVVVVAVLVSPYQKFPIGRCRHDFRSITLFR